MQTGAELSRTGTSAALADRRRASSRPLARVLLLIACALALLLCAAPSAFGDETSPSAPRVVKVALYEDGDYLKRNDRGELEGYNIEYLDEIARYVDWTYEYVEYPGFEPALAAIEAGEADLLPQVYRTDERAERMGFSSSPMCEIYTTLNVRLDDTRYAYEDFSAFSGMRVGVIAGGQDAAAFVQYSEDNGFSVDIVEYEATGELFDALDGGAVDAAAISHLGRSSRFRMIAQFAPEPAYFAIAPGHKEVADELDRAMDRLDLRDPDFAPLLYDRYFGVNTDQDPVFTEEESAYLASAPVLRVAYDTFRAPLSFRDPQTGEFAGAASLLFDDISRVTGLRFEFVPVDRHDKAFDLVQNGEADLVYGVDRDADRSGELLSTTGPYLRDPMALIAGANPDGTRIALPRGFALAGRMAQGAHAGDEVVLFDTPKECLNAVLDGRADIAYADTHVANYLLEESQYAGLRVTTTTTYYNHMSIGVSRAMDERLVSILDRCVQYTSGGAMTAWIAQSSLSAHPTSPLDFLRQYPLQIIAGLVALFALLLGAALYAGITRERAARRVKELSFSDPLTGGWSLARFRTEAGALLANARDGSYAIVYLDVKRFKSFNAAFGYGAGDEMLRALDGAIGALACEDEHWAHVVADEFVILSRWRGWDDLLERFDELDRRFNGADPLARLSHTLMLQAGVCVIERSPETPRIDAQSLIVFIDSARYARDSIGEVSRSEAALYSADMKERDVAERALVAAAREGLERGEFTAFYQPKVEIATNRLVGFEALARWESPERGLVPPDEFIPLFERTGLVRDLDLRMFRRVCARIREQIDAGERPLPIACNFSRLHLTDDSFPERVRGIADACGAPAGLLELELTEDLVMEDPKRAERQCQRLKDLGFRIAIDDFGSGYSSLGTLQNLPIDVLKLDRSFLMSSESGERCRAVLDGVVSIADRLDVDVVVEGVETREQAAMLVRMDERIIAQGYYYSRPVPRAASDAQFAAGSLEPSGSA
ncbi:EAL domain-containing protein [Arabiibacter massiliensis]|uniref:EAL domain-containing protein n=1 Tax=Arabiibacter massiliensis TaxID=1870985 RepID=UPI0009BC3BDE|nr:EAL domain-containing protein [Arabiibacter massiliensis]